MRKIAALLLCLLLLFQMASCTATEQNSSVNSPSKPEVLSYDRQKAADIATGCVNALISGDYNSIIGQLNTETGAALSVEQLEQAWKQLAPALGNFVSHGQTDITASEHLVTVTQFSEFALYQLVTTITLDAGDKLGAFWLNLAPLSPPIESGDGFTERAIVVGEHQLNGKLTLPAGIEKPPVAIMVQGSGSSGMDERVGAVGNRPFEDLARGLAKLGIATIRYDKRYYSHPELGTGTNAQHLTIYDEVLDDVYAAIELAGTLPEVDTEQIYLIGHSLGGMLAPKIAAENPLVKGIVSMAGSPRGLEDVIYDQNMAVLDADSTLSDEQRSALKLQVESLVAQIKALTGPEGEPILQMPASYWYSLNQSHGEQYLPNLEIPILILQGDADFQVSVEKDYSAYRAVLEGRNAVFRLYPGLNHLFMASDGQHSTAEYDIPAKMDMGVIEDIAEWIHSHST